MTRKSSAHSIFPKPDHDHRRCANDAIAHAEVICATRKERLTPIRRRVLEALLAHEEDAKDQNLPYMEWYALEPVIGADKQAGAELLGKVKIAKVRELIARRMAMK